MLMVTGHGDVFDRERPDWWKDVHHLGKPFRILKRRADGTKVTRQEAADAIMLEIAELLPEYQRGVFTDLAAWRERLRGVTAPIDT